MIKRRYKLPIRGTVIAREPLTGANDDPIRIIDLIELIPLKEGTELGKIEVPKGFRYECLNYNIDEEWCEVELEADEEFHTWLTGILPQLRTIQEEKGWKLDKSRMREELDKEGG